MIAVTGAAGLTGGAIVWGLAEGGARVRAIVRRAETEVDGAAEVAIADLRDPDATRRALSGCEVLVHVAGILLGSDLARADALRSPRAVLVVSSAGVRSQHRASASAYLAGEQAILGARPDATIVRPTMIYGASRDRNVHHVLRFARRYRFLPLFGDGRALLQPIHYQDLAAAIVALARDATPGGVIDAGGEAPLSIQEAATAVFEALRLRPRILRVPLGFATALARLADAARGGRLAERILRSSEDRDADNTALIERTGVRPRSFRQGVRDEAGEMGLA